MRFTIDQPDIEQLLSIVSRASENRPLLPQLANIYLAADQGLVATGTNLQLTIDSYWDCDIEESGEFTIPARELLQLISTLDKTKQVNFSLDSTNMTMHIQSGKTKANLKGISAENFPLPKQFDRVQEFTLPREQLVDALDHTLYACDPESNTPMQRGLSLYFRNGELRFYANSGFRLAQQTVALKVETDGDEMEVILPQRSLMEVKNIYARSAAASISMLLMWGDDGELQMVNFDDGAVSITSQVIAGKLAKDIASIIPSISFSVPIEVQPLRIALKRMAIFSADSNNSVEMIFFNNEFYLNARSQERGGGEDVIECDYQGERFSQIYNVRYLIDALDSFDTSDQIILNFHKLSETMYALSITSEKQADLIALLSPMATRGT